MDSATQSMNAILNGPDYEAVEMPIPVFDQHKEFDEKGRLLRDFTPAKLQEIVNVCNARRRTADFSPIGPGHTVSDQYDAKGQIIYKAKETDNPPIWGYAGEYKLGRYGPEQKLAILSKFYMRKRIVLPDGRVITGRQALEEFPRRSVELWYAENLIDWIALLKRTPERELGTTAGANSYAKILSNAPWELLQDRVFGSYERKTRTRAAFTREGNRQKLRYSMETNMADFDPTGAPDAAAPPVPPPTPEGGLPPEEGQKAIQYFKHCLGNHPVGKYMAEQAKGAGVTDEPAAAPPAPAPGAPAQYEGEGFPSGTDTFAPDALKKPEPDKNARKGQPDRYQAQQQQITALQNQLKMRDLLGVYAKDLAGLVQDGYEIDIDEEVDDVADVDPRDFQRVTEKNKARIVSRYQRSPIGGQMINARIPTNNNSGPTYEQAEKAKSLATAKGIDFDAALSQVLGK